jgi:hypothetical protein
MLETDVSEMDERIAEVDAGVKEPVKLDREKLRMELFADIKIVINDDDDGDSDLTVITANILSTLIILLWLRGYPCHPSSSLPPQHQVSRFRTY